ncbi:hypothetical protein [Streptomyces sp. NPDC058045]|uniref:hypothetical protein n=1 Tax=Streptomyces sp. NPDC058045 TaxID=3346311 RepID=UPI0036E43E1F
MSREMQVLPLAVCLGMTLLYFAISAFLKRHSNRALSQEAEHYAEQWLLDVRSRRAAYFLKVALEIRADQQALWKMDGFRMGVEQAHRLRAYEDVPRQRLRLVQGESGAETARGERPGHAS